MWRAKQSCGTVFIFVVLHYCTVVLLEIALYWYRQGSGPQMGTHSVTVWSTFLESLFGHFSGTPFFRYLEKTGPPNDTETESLFETLDLVKV